MFTKKFVANMLPQFFFLILAASISPNSASGEFDKESIELARQLSNEKIPRPEVQSFDASVDLAQRVHFRIFKVVKNICQQESVNRQDCRWNIKVRRDAGFYANASSSNQIIISSGLIDQITYEDELAFVVAHEVAHYLLGHARKNIDTIFIGAILGDLFLDNLASGILIASIIDKAGSRKFESNADAVALKIIRHAGYDIKKARYVLLRMAKMEKRIISRFMQSHPSGFERILSFDQLAEEI